ncbi:MAG: hypothetical protein JXR91_04530, partial [Deltaproteobacteria bacterium]|nr:hypothetical protein [Deltaproteobacteria bacterium]
MRLLLLLSKIQKVDRRYIFLGIFLAVAVPFFIPVEFAAKPGAETRRFDNELAVIMQKEKPILIDIDFGPQTMAEMEPMLRGVLDRVFASRQKVVFLTFMTEAASPVREYLVEMEKKYNLRYGSDYVFLGYASAYAYTMNGLGKSFKAYFHSDDRGTPIERLPLMQGVRSLKDIGGIINIASNSFP